ncbi:MAG: hypothetical protein ACYDH5_03845 [Acidimicrobiales bacterium]
MRTPGWRRRIGLVAKTAAVSGALAAGLLGAGLTAAQAQGVSATPSCGYSSQTGTSPGASQAGKVVGMAASAGGTGYWVASSTGQVASCGTATQLGSLIIPRPNPPPVVSIASAPNGKGIFLATATGGVYAFGAATPHGSIPAAMRLDQPIVGMAADPATGGYWLVARDGGVFSFDAPFYGSMGGKALNQPVVGMAATPRGHGYWLVARDGGVFSFGSAAFHGSMAGKALNRPIVAVAADPATGGYWLVAADGGVFSFAAAFYGSTGGIPINQGSVGIAVTPGGRGYRLAASDGGVFDFGNAAFEGSAATVDWAAVHYPIQSSTDCSGRPPQVLQVHDATPAPGEQVAIVIVNCIAGAGTPPVEIYVYDNATVFGPHLVQTLVPYTDLWRLPAPPPPRFVPQDPITSQGPNLSIRLNGYSPTNTPPDCCPNVFATLTWTWTGSSYEQTGRVPPHTHLPWPG